MRTTLRLTRLLLLITFLCDPILSDDATSSSVGPTTAPTVSKPRTVPGSTVVSTKLPTIAPSPTLPPTTNVSKTSPARAPTTPTATPTTAPTATPTTAHTTAPTAAPTATPTAAPTTAPTAAPTATPTTAHIAAHTAAPTTAPTAAHIAAHAAAHTAASTAVPTTVNINTSPGATSIEPKALTVSIGSTGTLVLPSLETVTHQQTKTATTSKTLELPAVISSDTSAVATTMTTKILNIVPVTGQGVGNHTHLVSTPSQAGEIGGVTVTKEGPTTRPEPKAITPTEPAPETGTTALPEQPKIVLPKDSYTGTTTQKTTTYSPATPIIGTISTKSTTTRVALLKKFTYSLLSEQETKEEKDLAEVCKRLMPDWQNGTCTLMWRHHNEKVEFDLVEINGNVKTSLATQLYEEITKKPTDNRTLIAILASCGALLIMIVILAVCASHHRKPYNENQQHLTEELNTVENGYHDNPTLEVMEVQPEMQEKKMALNGEFNDSWIVPIDNLLKEEFQDEEDTHL